MPSPFPGMDPYLEDPAHWPGVHTRLIAATQTALNRVVRPKYLAVIEDRVYVSDEPEDAPRAVRVPDVMVREQDAGAVAVATTAVLDEPVILRTMVRVRRTERRVEVREAGTRTVVAVVEILSPANKRAGSKGRASYLRKRREVLRSPAALVEIDLLRAGTPLFARPPDRPADYAVHVSPAALRPRGRVWAVPLPARLPAVGIPLAGADPDAPLDLQAVFTSAYNDGALDGLADYRREPVPPLPPDLAAWAGELLRAGHLR